METGECTYQSIWPSSKQGTDSGCLSEVLNHFPKKDLRHQQEDCRNRSHFEQGWPSRIPEQSSSCSRNNQKQQKIKILENKYLLSRRNKQPLQQPANVRNGFQLEVCAAMCATMFFAARRGDFSSFDTRAQNHPHPFTLHPNIILHIWICVQNRKSF